MTRAGDFRAVLRRGRRVSTPSAVIHMLDRDSGPIRFGFIVSKAVGGAVTRNAVKRRLRASCRDMISELGASRDVVIRALPGIDVRTWPELHSELSEGMRRIVR
jgi:ribonuclease P protein component